ncbi:hypothetical protein Pmani_026875, partial [Petrolisthes manimaculis]
CRASQGRVGPGGGVEVMDFQNRIKRFQQDQQQQQLQHQQHMSSSSSSRSSSSSSQLKRSQLSSTHSHSSSNLSSSEVKSSELKSTANKSNLSELKSSMSEVKSNISEMSQSNSVNYNRSLSMASNAASSLQQSSSASSALQQAGFNKRKASGLLGSMDALNDALQMGDEQLALPDVEKDFDLDTLSAAGQQDQLSSSPLNSGTSNGSNPKELKFEQKKVTSSSKTKVVTDKNSFESASGQSSESRKLQAGDVSYAETSKKAATKAKIEVDGYTAEKAAAVSQVS